MEKRLTVKMSSKHSPSSIPTLGVEKQKSFKLDADTSAVEEKQKSFKLDADTSAVEEKQKSFKLDADTSAVEENSPKPGTPPKIYSRVSLHGPL